MTTEAEYLGNTPKSGNAPLAPSSASALQDAAALYERARLAADSGEALEALTIGAEAVGMAAVAADLERREAAAAMLAPRAYGHAVTDREYRNRLAGSQEAARLALVMDGTAAILHSVDSMVADYVEPTVSCNSYPTALELVDGPTCCDRHRQAHSAATGGAL